MSESVQIEDLLRRFYTNQGKLRGYVFSATRDYHATEDILQEIAITVAKKASTFDSERPAMPWFMGIARNQIQRFYRARGRDARNVSFEVLGECLPMFDSFGAEVVSSRRVALKKCVGKLPGKQQKVMELRYIDDMDCTQIASTLGRSVQGIYSLLKRMKTELRKCVEFQLQGGTSLMSNPANQNMLDLVSDYFLRELSDDELTRLQQAMQSDAAVRQAFAEASRDEWLMHHVYHMDEGRIVHFEPRKRSLRRMRAIAAGVAILVSLGAAFLANKTSITLYVASKSSATVLAEVEDFYVLKGEAISVVNHGLVRKLNNGSKLRNGDRVVVPAGCRLSFQYLGEDTHVRLGGGSLFQIADLDGAKNIRLTQGVLLADVAKQPKDLPMSVTTSDAEAVVLGTSFEIMADGVSRLSVSSGKVAFKSISDGRRVVVKSGHLADSGGSSWVARPYRLAKLAPVEDKTLNLEKDRQFIAIDPVRNYKGFLKFNLGSFSGQLLEAKLRLRVMRKKSDFGGSGDVRLFRVHPDRTGAGERIQVAHYSGAVGAGMDLEFDIDPSTLSQGINALLIELDENGNDFWFSSSEGAVAPRLTLKVVGEQ